MRRLYIAGALLLCATPALALEGTAAPLRDGEYDCSVYSGFLMAMGKMDIKGATYRFRPYGKVTNGFSPYSVGGDGTLAWSGPMGALNKAPAALVDSKRTPQGFNIRYKVREGAYIDTMSCHPAG